VVAKRRRVVVRWQPKKGRLKVENKKITKRMVDDLKPREDRFVVWDTDVAGFGVRVNKNGRKTYLLKYRVGGGRSGRVRWAVIGTHGALTPDQARDTARRWAADVAAGGDPAAVRDEKRSAPTMADLLARYLQDHVNQRNKPTTQTLVADIVRRDLLPFFGKRKVADVTETDVAKFHSGMSSRPISANRAIAYLSKAFSLAELWGFRPRHSNPCSAIERYRENSRKRYLSPKEFAALGDALSKADAGQLRIPDEAGGLRHVNVNPQAVAAIRLLVLTGARRGEILGLRWEFIDFAAGRINLPDSKTGAKSIQLPAAALDVLKSLVMPEDGRGFVIRGGDATKATVPLTNIKDPWSHIRNAAGLSDVRLHDLRHAFASVAVAGGASLPLIGALLGHASVSTTARYAHLADDPLRAAAEMVSNRITSAMNPERMTAEIVPFKRET
jgi:integrase